MILYSCSIPHTLSSRTSYVISIVGILEITMFWWAISPEVLMNLICNMCSEITCTITATSPETNELLIKHTKQTRATRTPAFWEYPLLPHDTPYYQFISDPFHSKSKLFCNYKFMNLTKPMLTISLEPYGITGLCCGGTWLYKVHASKYEKEWHHSTMQTQR